MTARSDLFRDLSRRRAASIAAVALGDGLALLFAITAGNLFLWFWRGTPIRVEYSLWVLPAWYATAIVQRLLPGWGMSVVEELRRVEISLVVVFGLAAVVVFLTRYGAAASRLNFLLACTSSVLLMPAVRHIVKRGLIRWGVWGLPAVFYGEAGALPAAVQAFREEPYLGILPAAVCTDGAWEPAAPAGLKAWGGLKAQAPAPVAVLLASGLSRDTLSAMLDRLNAHYPTVILLPDFVDLPTLWVRPLDMAEMTAVEISNNLLHVPARMMKRAFELLLVLFLSPIWGTLFALTAVGLLLCERRVPFYFQERIGLDGRPFRTWKFCTMCPDAEDRLEQALVGSPDYRMEWERYGKLRADPRVTRAGRFLRRWSLDEIPQFFQVLAGSMALIGPRPLPRYHHEQLRPAVRTLRARVRPGVTGLWQVQGRSASGNEGLEIWDAYYVRNWSLWLDVVILLQTVRAVLAGRGAY